MFLPYLNYGTLLWGTHNAILTKIQKKAIRIISGSKYNAHTEPIFKKLHILKIDNLCTLRGAKFCYQLENNTLPVYFYSGIFTKNSELHEYSTRGLNNYQYPNLKHEFMKETLRYRIPKTFNCTPPLIKDKISTHTIKAFSKYVKNYFIERYNINCTIPNCYICQ